jgi:hypothetical protein
MSKSWKSISVSIHFRFNSQLDEVNNQVADLLNDFEVAPTEVVATSTFFGESTSVGYKRGAVHLLVFTDKSVDENVKIDFEPEEAREMQRLSRR